MLLMFAVVDIAGSQVRVEKGRTLRVPKLDSETGSQQRFSNVLLVSDAGKTNTGKPFVEGAAVEATIIGHGRGDKVIVFKMKRRKKYRRRNGHRQDFTEIRVDEITSPG